MHCIMSLPHLVLSSTLVSPHGDNYGIGQEEQHALYEVFSLDETHSTVFHQHNPDPPHTQILDPRSTSMFPVLHFLLHLNLERLPDSFVVLPYCDKIGRMPR